MTARPPVTPDGRYIVVAGGAGPRLWRATRPDLPPETQAAWTARLMDARRTIRNAGGDPERVRAARAEVHAAKCALGERGPVWWEDGAPDLNRRLVRNTPYAAWWDARDGSE